MYQTRIINETVDGLTNWVWPVTDIGAWEGPRNDWNFSHKVKYFKNVKSRNVIITAGANCGLYARLYSGIFQYVYAFEPDPANFHCLVNNCQTDNVIKMQCALGSERKPISLYRKDMSNVGMHVVDDNTPGMIPMITIDSLNLHMCDVIQLDVEGYEHNVLLGAEETVEKFKPVLILENGEEDNISEFMRKHKYTIQDNSCFDTIWIPKE